jgi:hypothetical protein
MDVTGLRLAEAILRGGRSRQAERDRETSHLAWNTTDIPSYRASSDRSRRDVIGPVTSPTPK